MNRPVEPPLGPRFGTALRPALSIRKIPAPPFRELIGLGLRGVHRRAGAANGPAGLGRIERV